MTRTKRGSKKYINIVENKEEEISDNEYQKRLEQWDINSLLEYLFKDERISKEKNTKKEKVFSFSKDENSKVYFSFFPIKNSGMDNSKKRMQIPEGYFGLGNRAVDFGKNIYFFIGIYPSSLTDPIFIILDNDGVSLNPTKSYSSLWISYDSLKNANKNGINYAINKINGNKYICFKKKYWTLIKNAIVQENFSSIIKNSGVNYISKNDEIIKDTLNVEIEIEKYDERKDAYILNNKQKLKKNPNYRDLILYESGYRCSLCNKDITFKTNNDIMYFEAHHLIPCNFNMQTKFEKKLDAPSNMYCLCPECHRKIHFIKDTEISPLLERLYKMRQKIYQKNYNLDFNKLITIYQNINRSQELEM